MQVGAHVVGFGRRGVIDIAADVAVVLFGDDLRLRHPSRISRNIFVGAVGVDDLVDVFRAQVVLRLAFAVFAVSVDEQHMVALGRAILVHHQDAGGDAGAVEEVAGQADDRLQIAALDKVFACFALLTAPEQHTVRHYGRHAAIVLEYRQHVLHKHQIGLFAFFRHHHRKAAREFEVFFDVVLAEGRIGHHAIEALQFVAFVQMLRIAQGVFLADVSVGDAMQQHVHFADRPGGAHFLLAKQRQFIGTAAFFAQVVAHLDQHAA